MAAPSTRFVFSVLGRFWHLLDGLRRALMNLLLLALVVAALVGWLRREPAPLQDQTALVLAIQGPIHEQFAGSVRENAIEQAQGRSIEQTRLRDVLGALDAAAHDPKIARVLLVLDDFAGAGMPTLREVAAAVDRARAAGKQVVAWGTGYDQRQYYIAAHADEVWLDPMGSVQIQGFGGYRNYYKDALDRLGVAVHVIKVGQYKNFGEAYVANAPSPQTTEEDSQLYGALWASYAQGVEKARRLAPGSLQALLDAVPERLAAAGGDEAKMALDAHLVDALETREQMRATLIERGARDGQSFRQIGFQNYLAHIKPATGGDALAVIVAEGEIVDGQADGGAIGGESTAELVRQARNDEHVKAIVLRVDSPGGSAFGAELVRRELALARKAGKPVVVSMGDVAASGGYWIATAADEVIADADTITGSIGVIAILPTAEKTMAKLGLHTGGYTTSWLVGAYDPRRGLDPRMEQLIQSSIDHTYAEFTARAAEARKTTPQQIDSVGQGRVWTGSQALARRLVDRNGSFADAIQAAARLGGLGASPRLDYFEREPGRLERLIALIGTRVAAELGSSSASGAWPLLALGGSNPALGDIAHQLAWLGDLGRGRKPFEAVAHCLCTAP
ncbi:MAG: signal peptide peptidase SppA [Burkholderiales bacterium]|nr:signal peptide peptidase SppA [Burkholderiales bacterium]